MTSQPAGMTEHGLKPDAFADNRIVLIWSDEHRAWWKPTANGYTDDRDEAGRWWLKDAWLQTKHCDPSKRIMFETAKRGSCRVSLEAFCRDERQDRENAKRDRNI
jgi:hypothetical protein